MLLPRRPVGWPEWLAEGVFNTIVNTWICLIHFGSRKYCGPLH